MDYSQPITVENAMRVAYDFAIDRCVDWLQDHDCDDPQKTAKTLKEAMYSPLEDEDDDDKCPKLICRLAHRCVTPWDCNGPHIPQEDN